MHGGGLMDSTTVGNLPGAGHSGGMVNCSSLPGNTCDRLERSLERYTARYGLTVDSGLEIRVTCDIARSETYPSIPVR